MQGLTLPLCFRTLNLGLILKNATIQHKIIGVIKHFAKGYFKKMSIELHWADCFDVFPSIKDQSIDLVLCDPPYGTTACKWDSVLPLDLMWKELERIVKPDKPIILFGSEPFSSVLRLSNLKNYKYDWYWQKEKPTNPMQLKNRPGKTIETISVFYKKQTNYFPVKTKHFGKLVKNKPSETATVGSLVTKNKLKVKPYNDDGTRYPTQVLSFNREVLTKIVHPTQKPVALLEYLIKTYSLEGETVLDFTMGSGSTGVACKNTNRSFIGIEKEKEYFDIAKQRILTEGIQEPEIDICSMFN